MCDCGQGVKKRRGFVGFRANRASASTAGGQGKRGTTKTTASTLYSQAQQRGGRALCCVCGWWLRGLGLVLFRFLVKMWSLSSFRHRKKHRLLPPSSLTLPYPTLKHRGSHKPGRKGRGAPAPPSRLFLVPRTRECAAADSLPAPSPCCLPSFPPSSYYNLTWHLRRRPK